MEDYTRGIIYAWIVLIAIGGIVYIKYVILTPQQNSEAYDAAQTVDPTNRQLLTGQANIYKFGSQQYRNVTYSDGSVVPSVTMSIEQFNQTTHKWDVIGYTNTHLHKLKIDANDKVDISIGHTDRINIKTTGAPNTPPPPVID